MRQRKMRIFSTLFALIFTAGFAMADAAADAENTLVIEIAGENAGVVEIALAADMAPNHVAQIKMLARAGKYDNVVFHRVIDGFMAQTGDVQFGMRDGENQNRAGMGASDLPDITAEFSDMPYKIGTVGMARSNDPDSANSQFFIMFEPAPFLDGKYTVIGNVISGQEVVDKIKRGAGQNGSVTDPDYMASVRVKADL